MWSDQSQTTRRRAIKLVAAGVAGSTVLTSRVGAEHSDSGIGASEAQQIGDRAKALLEDLQTLDQRSEVDIDDDVISTIQQHIDNGDGDYDLGGYHDAHQSYQRAVEQAVPVLEKGYREGAETLLDSSEDYLQQLEDQGYIVPDKELYQNRIEEQRRQLEQAESLDDVREVYQQVRNQLWQDIQSLPDPMIVDAVNTMTSPVVLAATGILVIGTGAGVVWVAKNNSNGPSKY